MPRARILIFLFSAAVYYTWTERIMRRFQKQKVDYARRVRKIVLPLHIKGQQKSQWKSFLEKMNILIGE